MKLRQRLVSALLVALVFSTLAYAAPARNFLPLSKIVPGQKAIAKSVFKGTKIDTFHLEILGVMPRFEGTTRSVILARVLDGPVVKRQTAIIEGMSGSPVYIDGKLIGAIAYGWQYSKEPIAGIQPIEYMLEAWRPLDKPVVTPPVRAVSVGGQRIDQVKVSPGPTGEKDPPGTVTLRPLGGLIQVSGLNARATQRLNDALGKYGLRAVAGPGGGGQLDNMRPPLVPGASVGALLARGDIDVAYMGTITYVEDGRLLAFGHPLAQFGDVDLPLTGGYVYDIMPTLDSSFKMMAPTATVGRLFRDHDAAIAGEMHGAASMLPVRVTVRDRGGPWHSYSFEVVRQREVMPILVASTVLGLADEARTRVARGSVKMSLDLDFKNRPSIHRADVSYSDSDAALAALPAVLAPLTVLTDNPFGPVPITRVQLKLDYEDARHTATIERAVVNQSRYRAGDTVAISLSVRPYGKAPVTIPVQFTLPADLPKGTVRVGITGGKDANTGRAALGAPLPDPTNVEQMLEQYTHKNSSSELVTQVALTRGGAALLGQELPDLPRAAYDVLQSSRPTDLRVMPTILKVVTPTEYALSGRAQLTLQVDSEIAPGAARPESGPPPPSLRPSAPTDDDDSSLEDIGDSDSASVSGSEMTEAVPPAHAAKTPEKEATPAEPSADEPKPEPKKEKPLSSASPSWVHRAKADYAKARLNGVAVAADGSLSLAPATRSAAAMPADAIWSIAVRNGVSYVGTGATGLVYKVTDTGEVTKFFSTGEMNVTALAFDSAGRLYAATSPHGRLYRINADGQGELLYECGRPHLWCLTFGPDGTLYAGAGSPAGVYTISPEGKGKLLADVKAVHVLSLLLAPNGDLYAGTAGAGLLYRIKPDGSANLATQGSGTSITALAQDAAGNVYYASSPTGDIQRLPVSGLPGIYARTEQTTVYGLAAQPDGSLLAATGPNGVLLRIPQANQVDVLERPETGLVSALAVSGDTLYLGRTAPTALRRLALSGGTSGQLESAVMDADHTARWGRARVIADTPEGGAVKVETRSGDSVNPDDRWSEWILTGNDNLIRSPSARYLQYRLTLSRADGKPSPRVRELHLSRMPVNRPPTVTIKAPSGEACVAKKFTVKWDGHDPDQNSLVYDLSLSSDMGKTWTTLKSEVTETKYEWDTTKKPDGAYLLRVTASDRRCQPWSPESESDTLAVTVDNTPPTVVLSTQSMTVAAEHQVKLSGVVTDKLTPIVSVEYRIDDGDWHSVPFAVVDSPVTDFVFTTEALALGDHRIEVHAFDAANNVTTEKAGVSITATGGNSITPPAETKTPPKETPSDAKDSD